MKWSGPFEVVKKDSDFKRTVKNIVDGTEKTLHTALLKDWTNVLNEDISTLREQAGYSAEGFEIEKVEQHNKKQGQIWVLVKWLGFDEAENSWEPLQTIYAANPEAVNKYMDMLNAKSRDMLSRYINKYL